MQNTNILLSREIKIADNISINIPTIQEVMDFGESEFFSLSQMLCSVPHDLALLLEDTFHIDFTDITDYELFISVICPIYKNAKINTDIVIRGIDFSKLEEEYDTKNDIVYMVDRENDIVINPIIHKKISDSIRLLHSWEKDETSYKKIRNYELNKLRKASQKQSKNVSSGALSSLIVTAVNNKDFKYNYETVTQLTITQFYKSVEQIIHNLSVDHTMQGIYAGTVDIDKINKKELSLIMSK